MEAAPRRGLPIEGLPLNSSLRHKLQCAGFRTTAELAAVAGPVELAAGGPEHRRRRRRPPASPLAMTSRVAASMTCPLWPLTAAEAQLTHEEALLALKLAAPTVGGAAAGAAAASAPLSARQIFEREAAAKRIITFAAELDGILGGGVETGAITEFWWVLLQRCTRLMSVMHTGRLAGTAFFHVLLGCT